MCNNMVVYTMQLLINYALKFFYKLKKLKYNKIIVSVNRFLLLN